MTFVLECLKHSIYKIFLLVNIAIAPEVLSLYRLHLGLDNYTGKIYSTKNNADKIKKEIQGLIPGKKAPDRNLDSTERIVLLYMFAISCDGKSALQHV